MAVPGGLRRSPGPSGLLLAVPQRPAGDALSKPIAVSIMVRTSMFGVSHSVYLALVGADHCLECLGSVDRMRWLIFGHSVARLPCSQPVEI